MNVQLPDIAALQLQVELDSNRRGELRKSKDACDLYRQTRAAKDFPVLKRSASSIFVHHTLALWSLPHKSSSFPNGKIHAKTGEVVIPSASTAHPRTRATSLGLAEVSRPSIAESDEGIFGSKMLYWWSRVHHPCLCTQRLWRNRSKRVVSNHTGIILSSPNSKNTDAWFCSKFY